jgi:hypothetical protein
VAVGFGFSPYGIFPYGFGGVVPYPIGTAKITIPHLLTGEYDSTGIMISFDAWINPTTSTDTALLCKGGGATSPDWYFGYVGTNLKFALTDSGGTTTDIFVVPAAGYEYRWVPMVMGITTIGGNTSAYVCIDNAIAATAGPLAGVTRQTNTDDIISGMGGRIRNIRIHDAYSSPSTAVKFGDKFMSYMDNLLSSSLVGAWDIDDNSFTLADSSSTGNDGTLWAGGLWSNGANDLSSSGLPVWTSTSGIGRRDTSKINFMRNVQTTAPGSIVVEQNLDDANRTDIFDGDAGNKVRLVSDDVSGVILTFEHPFLKERKNEIELNRQISVLGGGTVAAGTQYTWTLPSSADLGYEIDSIEAGINSIKVLFNTDIKEGNGVVSGIDPAMMQWLKNGVIIYTDDTGSQTVTLSEFTDVSGNIIPPTTANITVLEEAIRFDYQGMQMVQSKSYKDSFEAKISRESKNYISEKLREKRGDL